MKIEFTLPSRRSVPPPAFTPVPVSDPEERPHRIARVMALAHKLDELVRSGEVTDHWGVGPARDMFRQRGSAST
jgi:hypothetical protein